MIPRQSTSARSVESSQISFAGGRRLSRALSAAVLNAFLFAAVGTASAAPEDVIAVLSQRDEYRGTASLQQLEELAGGEDELVALLLEYRTKETPPFVGIRSEKTLLNYAHRDDVRDALANDITSPAHTGLARVIGMHIDSVSDTTARRLFAERVLSRAANDPDFARYGRMLLESTDSNVRSLAKRSFGE